MLSFITVLGQEIKVEILMVQVPGMMFSYEVCSGATEEKGVCGGKVEGGDGKMRMDTLGKVADIVTGDQVRQGECTIYTEKKSKVDNQQHHQCSVATKGQTPFHPLIL